MATSEDEFVNLNLSKLEQVKKIYSHASCPDGTMAALICAAAYEMIGLSPSIEFIQYGTKSEDELEPEPGQLFVDIAPPEDRWEDWRDVEPVVLDHHETREHITRGLDGIYGYPVYSGASLAFAYIMLPIAAHVSLEKNCAGKWAKYAELAQIRDTWKTDRSEWVDAASFGQGLSFFGSEYLLGLIKDDKLDFDEILKIGKIKYDKILRKANLIAKSSYFSTLSHNGRQYKLAFFNSTEKNISEVCHHLIEEMGCDFASGYFATCKDDKPITIVSLRTSSGLNARKIAEIFGGGGHPTAAGFKIFGDASISNIVGHVKSGIKRIV